MQSAVLVVAVGVLAVIAYRDVCVRRIPNALSLAIGLLGMTRIALAQDAAAAGYTLAAAAVVLAVGFALFWRGAIGGGDAKLVAAMALLIGYHALLGFLFLMSLCGGMLALGAVARNWLRSRLVSLWRGTKISALGDPAPADSTVPYGVAVAVAGIVTLFVAR
jgi:prepilin peptidase CpaA